MASPTLVSIKPRATNKMKMGKQSSAEAKKASTRRSYRTTEIDVNKAVRKEVLALFKTRLNLGENAAREFAEAFTANSR